MFIKQLSVFMENKAGRMAEISRILASGGVNIRALSVADTTGFGILRLIVDDPEKAERVCRAAGLTTALTDAIAIARRTKRVMLQAVIAGLVLATIGMIAAAFNLIPVVVGAFLQEAIDVVSILWALTALIDRD